MYQDDHLLAVLCMCLDPLLPPPTPRAPGTYFLFKQKVPILLKQANTRKRERRRARERLRDKRRKEGGREGGRCAE